MHPAMLVGAFAGIVIAALMITFMEDRMSYRYESDRYEWTNGYPADHPVGQPR